MFSRIAVIPFQQINKSQTLESCLDLKASLQPLLRKAVLSLGILVEMSDEFEAMRQDVLFKEICILIGQAGLDMWSQLNYALLLFSTGKVRNLFVFNEIETYTIC